MGVLVDGELNDPTSSGVWKSPIRPPTGGSIVSGISISEDGIVVSLIELLSEEMVCDNRKEKVQETKKVKFLIFIYTLFFNY